MTDEHPNRGLLEFLKKKEDWYDPHDLLADPNFLAARDDKQMQTVSDVSPKLPHGSVLGQYYGETYVMDHSDGYAKPASEFR